ncbi:N-acetyltransferase family protein [Aeromicrobium sp. CF3.5]|uniref:GNAT family N-acetyltransferase n=1 Tax=Aeromicrobium sp. CF3.5 TaxID=3373078 RepID=UPI003EE756C5
MTIRPRVVLDLPPLADALMAQQAETRYPFRDPLPFPVEEFLHAHDASSAWTAELHGRPVGHACRTDQARAMGADEQLNLACARAHGCKVADLTWVGALFVAREARGLGIGRRLLHAVVDDARRNHQHPCLEVLPVHPGAMALYLSTGWRTIGTVRPGWLRDAIGDDGPDVAVMVLTCGG